MFATTQYQQATPVPSCGAGSAPQTKAEAAIQTLLRLIRRGFSCSAGASGGKDSTVVVMLLIEAVRRAAAEGIRVPHYVCSAITGVDNPSMENHLFAIHDEIRAHCADHDLPIEVKTVYPSLASSFVVSTVGRGTLPRFPENASSRTCSIDYKVAPAQRLARELEREVIQQTGQEIISLIGTRFDESASRSERMTARRESATVPSRDSGGRLVLSLIADWTLTDVWDALELLLQPEESPYLSAISPESVSRLFTLYKDGNSGVCGVVLGDQGNKQICGARFGCWTCTLTGEKDRSMESQLTEPKYQYMRPLNDFRNLLMATQFDLDRRELIGRKVSVAGYIAVQPDVYSLEFRREMLWHLLTIDADERDRAEQVDADIATGKLPDTAENRRMASPAFEIVSLQHLALIDFHWGMHAYSPRAFPALAIWYEVNVLNRRRRVPKTVKAPKLGIPTKRWFHVGAFDKDAPAAGLFDARTEAWNKHRHPSRPATHKVVNGERVTWFDEDDSISVDPEAVCAFITCTFPSMFLDTQHMAGIESATFWLNEEMVRLPKGQAGRYQQMSVRNTYIGNLAERLGLTPKEMDAYLVKNSISNADHSKLVPAAQLERDEEESGGQFSLFDLPIAA